MVHSLPAAVQVRILPPSRFRQPIILFQSPFSRSINVGFLQNHGSKFRFVPGRLNFGSPREADTIQATRQTLTLPSVRQIQKRYKPETISTITVLREALACRLGNALAEVGIRNHYGDAFIGAWHIKGKGEIKTAYLYENIEGLTPNGLWIIADSICVGRNLVATLKSLLNKFQPQEILFISPTASRLGINNVGKLTAKKHIPTTFVAWGALFGVDEKTLYDMPWGHPDTEPLDKRDQDLVVSMYGKELCMGGDFGNNYYCPPLALKLYEEQLKEHRITPKIPSAEKILSIYKRSELVIR